MLFNNNSSSFTPTPKGPTARWTMWHPSENDGDYTEYKYSAYGNNIITCGRPTYSFCDVGEGKGYILFGWFLFILTKLGHQPCFSILKIEWCEKHDKKIIQI